MGGVNKNKAPTLYKFLDASSGWSLKNFKNIFQSCQLRASTPKELNDPFDSQTPPNLNLTREQIVFVREKYSFKSSIWQEPTDKLCEEFREVLRNVSLWYRVYSLSTNVENVLHWSHYANKHKGLCVGFNFNKQPDLGKSRDDLVLGPTKVSYLTSGKLATVSMARRRFRSDFYHHNFIGRVMNQIFLTKGQEWRYEQEWRIAFNAKEKSLPKEFLKINPAVIKEVIFGLMSTPPFIERRKVVISEFEEKHGLSIPLYKMVPREGTLTLKKVRL